MSTLCDIEINSCSYIIICLISRLFCLKGWSNYLLNWPDLFQKIDKLTLRSEWLCNKGPEPRCTNHIFVGTVGCPRVLANFWTFRRSWWFDLRIFFRVRATRTWTTIFVENQAFFIEFDYNLRTFEIGIWGQNNINIGFVTFSPSDQKT